MGINNNVNFWTFVNRKWNFCPFWSFSKVQCRNAKSLPIGLAWVSIIMLFVLFPAIKPSVLGLGWIQDAELDVGRHTKQSLKMFGINKKFPLTPKSIRHVSNRNIQSLQKVKQRTQINIKYIAFVMNVNRP